MTTPPEESRREYGARLREMLSAQAGGLQGSLQRAGTVAAAAYTLVGAIILLGAAGYAADAWLGTGPWLLMVGLLLGMVVGFYELARVAWRQTR